MVNKKEKTVNLALQGGGSHGAFCWGVLDYLLEDGRIINFDAIRKQSKLKIFLCATNCRALCKAVNCQQALISVKILLNKSLEELLP